MTGTEEKENNKISVTIQEEIRQERDNDLFDIQVTADKALTVCKLAAEYAENRSLEIQNIKDARMELINCVYILKEMFKSMDKQLEDTKTKYCSLYG